MEFIVKIPDERFTEKVKQCLFDRGEQSVNVLYIEDFTDLELAKVFIGNPFGEITSITKVIKLK